MPISPKTLWPNVVSLPDTVRWEVFDRDGNRCQLCGESERRALTVDHIIPVSRGGTHEMSNLQTLCRSCNASKGNRLGPQSIRRMDAKDSRRLRRLYAQFKGGARARLVSEARRLIAEGERPADVAAALGIRRQALHQLLTRTPDSEFGSDHVGIPSQGSTQ